MLNARKLEMQRLIAFIAICEEGGISAAARRLGIAQPALTVTVKKLESLLGAVLLERDARGIRATPAGRLLLQRAYEIVGAAEAAFLEVRDHGAAPAGEVSLGLPSSVSAVLALPLIEQISVRYPGIRLRLVEMFSGYLWNGLTEGELDLGVVFDRGPTAELDCQVMATEDMHLIGVPRRLPASPSIDIADLHGYPLVMPSSLHSVRSSLEAHAARAGSALNVRMEIDAGRQLIRLIEMGAVFSVLAPCAVGPEIGAGTLGARRISPRLSRQVCLAQRRDRISDAAVRAVAQTIESLSRALMADAVWPATAQ